MKDLRSGGSSSAALEGTVALFWSLSLPLGPVVEQRSGLNQQDIEFDLDILKQ